jgi:hypothetical protein
MALVPVAEALSACSRAPPSQAKASPCWMQPTGCWRSRSLHSAPNRPSTLPPWTAMPCGRGCSTVPAAVRIGTASPGGLYRGHSARAGAVAERLPEGGNAGIQCDRAASPSDRQTAAG